MISCAAIAVALLSPPTSGWVTTGPVVCDTRIVIRNVTKPVVLNAAGATFKDGITFQNVTGLTIKGGTYGTREKDTSVTYAIQASGVTNFSIANATFLAGPGGNRGGVQIRNGVRVTVRDSYFEGHRTGLMFYESTDLLATRNRFRKATSDGINIVGSHRGVISANSCFWTVRVGLAHPDCIQLWSLAGKPTQSDIWVVNNSAIGMMQGILSSDPKTEPGSGLRLHFHGNYTAVTFSHTVTCGLCRDSTATDNVLSSYPGAFFGDLGGSLKGFEPARGNTAARNVRYNGKVALPPRIYWYGPLPLEEKVGSEFDNRDHREAP